MLETMTKDSLTKGGEELNPRPQLSSLSPSSSSSSPPDTVPSCLAPKRKKSDAGGSSAEAAGSGSGGVGWEEGGQGGEGILSMREFFEAGGRSYEAYLKVCKERKDKMGSLPGSSSPNVSASNSSTEGQPHSALKVTANAHPPNSTEHSQASNPTAHGRAPPAASAAHVGSFPAEEKSRRLMTSSPEVLSLPPAAASGVCMTSDLIDQVIAVGLRTSLSDLPRFPVNCRSLRRPEARISFPFAPHSAAPPTVQSSSSDLSSSPPIKTTSGATPAPTTRQGCSVPALPLLTDSSRPGKSSPHSPWKRKPPSAHDEDETLVLDLTCKRSKTVAHSEAGNQLEYEPVTPPGECGGLFETDRSNGSRIGVTSRVSSAQSATIFSDVTQWSVDQVVRYVANVPGCRDYAEVFRQEEIDGACLIRLTERHLLSVMRMRLGPAMRLLQAIGTLSVNAWNSSENLSSQSFKK